MSLFRRAPKTEPCFFCAESVEKDTRHDHYRTHLIEVTDNNGNQAFTFRCPRCGLMDQAWGGGRSDPAGNASAAIVVHLNDRHGISMI